MADGSGAVGMTDLMRSIAAVDGRHLPVEGTLNFRDAGGYPTADGGVVAWRTLLRSDGLHRVGQAGFEQLTGLGLQTVLDLRVPEEIRVAPSPVDQLAESGTRVFHLSLIGDDFSELPMELEGVYQFVVDRRGQAIGSAIKSLAAPGAVPALVHCTAGKDRTGIVVAFTLAVIGVSDEIIAADYALSSLYLDPQLTPAIGQISADTGLDEQVTQAMMASPPELILQALDRARQQAGSVEGYLTRHGVTQNELAALKKVLVTADQRR
jgi:protein-tyrosine phosphatase